MKTRHTFQSGDKLLTVRQVAELTGYSRSRVYQLIDAEQLPAIRIPGDRATRVWLSDLDEFIEGEQ